MTKDKFIEIIELHQKQQEDLDKASDYINFDCSLFEFGWIMFDMLISESFNTKQADWIYWWLFERIDYNGQELPYYDEEDNEYYIHTADDLWNYIITLND